jgi:hypothetical protein
LDKGATGSIRISEKTPCDVLLTIGTNSRTLPTLTEFGLRRFAPVTYEHYASEEQALRKCKNVLGTRLR